MRTYQSLAKTALSLLLLVAFVSGCGGGAKKTNLAPDATQKTIDNAPAWFLNTPSDTNYLFATATSTSRDMNMAVRKAETSAKTSLAQQMEQKVANLTKQFQEEVGAGDSSELLQQFTTATKAVTSQTLMGARTNEKKLASESGLYRAYVLMSLPIGEANQQLMSKIQANKTLYTRFRGTKAFDELNEELQKSVQKGQ
jgi:hypothetical protein